MSLIIKNFPGKISARREMPLDYTFAQVSVGDSTCSCYGFNGTFNKDKVLFQESGENNGGCIEDDWDDTGVHKSVYDVVGNKHRFQTPYVE
jgi:hypothetical protein